VDRNLVVLDGSITAQNAAHLAAQIAKAEGQDVLGLFIVDDALILDRYASYQEELGWDEEPKSRAELVEWFEEDGNLVLEQLTEFCDEVDVPVETQILFGGIPELILDYAANAQMLTMGRRGKEHANDHGYLGSHFRHIAHHARIPLLVGGDTDQPIRSMYLLFDGSPCFDQAIDWAVRLQRDLSTKVNFSAMDQEDQHKMSPDFQEQLSQHGLTDYHYYPQPENSIQGVLEALTESGSDLIIVGGYRHPEVLEWMVGGRTDQLLRQSQLPVLIA